MRIMYVHGIGSSGGGNTVNMIKKYFPNDYIYSPDIPTTPIDAFEFIREAVKEHNINLIIGTSLGGFYTMMISGIPKIIINPAMEAPINIDKCIGRGIHEFLRPRKNGETHYNIDQTFIDELTYLYKRFFGDWFDFEYRTETYGVFGTEDKLINEQEFFKEKYGTTRFYTDTFEHRINEECFTRTVIPIICKIKERLE